MERFKDFDVARAEYEREPLRFRLAGREFTTVPILPAGPMIALARDHDQSGAAGFVAFGRFLETVVEKDADDPTRLDDALAETDWDTVRDLVNWILEESTTRPLSSASSSGSSVSWSSERSNGASVPTP